MTVTYSLGFIAAIFLSQVRLRPPPALLRPERQLLHEEAQQEDRLQGLPQDTLLVAAPHQLRPLLQPPLVAPRRRLPAAGTRQREVARDGKVPREARLHDVRQPRQVRPLQQPRLGAAEQVGFRYPDCSFVQK
jgi:hypothetical protein